MKPIIGMLFLLGVWSHVIAVGYDARKSDEFDLKVVFLYNIAKFTSWPDIASAESMLLCTLGEGKLIRAAKLLHGKKLHDTLLSVEKKYTDISCHIILIDTKHDADEHLFLETNSELPASLTVSDKPGFAKAGGMVELIRREGKIRFIINYDAVRSANLEISAKVLQLAEHVIMTVPVIAQ